MGQTDTKRVSLQEKNSRILTLLPSLASGLLRRQRYVDKIYGYIDDLVGQNEDKSLVELREAIEKMDKEGSLWDKDDVTVDPNKTILLTYAFGDMYTKALAMATSGNIRADVLTAKPVEEEQLKEIVAAYFNGKLEKGTQPVFLRVYSDVQSQEVPEKEANHWLELRRMLAEVGLLLVLETKKIEALTEKPEEKERKWPLGHSTSVDPYNWYCSSDEFLDSCDGTFPEIPITDILQHYEKNEENELLFDFLLKRKPKVHANELPICTQLLAVLIAAYNYESVPIRKEQISEPWQILEAVNIS